MLHKEFAKETLNVMQKQHKIRILFIHHSVGGDLVKHGSVRELLRKSDPNIGLWDYGYDPETIRGIHRLIALVQPHIYGLRNESGDLMTASLHIPNHNTDPDGLETLFTQPITDPPNNAFSCIIQYDVVMFKSCYPTTAVSSEKQLEDYQRFYLAIRDTIDKHPTRLFIPLTPPPLRANLTNGQQSARARQFAEWITSDTFCGRRKNLKPFNFFDALASPRGDKRPNTLRPEFCRPILFDSHPNAYAHKVVAPMLVAFVTKSIREYFCDEA